MYTETKYLHKRSDVLFLKYLHTRGIKYYKPLKVDKATDYLN